jgi:sarcosine oxidase subunit beta
MKVDFLVVGGGIYGCMTALRLAQKGAETMLLEAGEIAAGASGGPGKRGVRANNRDLRELPLMRLAYDIWPTLHEELASDTGYEQIGHLMLIESPREMIAAPALQWMQEGQGIETTVLSAAEVREIEPEVSKSVLGATYCPNDGVAAQRATTLAAADAARKAGANILEQTALVTVNADNSKVFSVITSTDQEIRIGKAVIFLSNTHTVDLLAEQFQLNLPVWKRLPQAMFTEPISTALPRHLIGHAHRRLAMKPAPEGAVMISGGWHGKWNSTTHRGEVQADQIEANLADARAVFPVLNSCSIASSAADRQESQTIDNIPIIDSVPGIDNAFFATGWCGHGWAIAPALGPLLAEWIFDRNKPELLAPFSLARFDRLITP